MSEAIDILDENLEDSNITELITHGSFWPTDIRKEEKNDCTVYVDDKKFESQLWRLSPIGGEFLLPIDSDVDFDNGTELSISMMLGNQKCEFSGLAVCSQYDSQHGKIFGVRWVPVSANRKSKNIDTRRATRWICSEAFLPTGVVTNPHKFHDIILFKVIDISSAGFQLRTSLRNKFLIPGMTFNGTFNFPLVGKTDLKFIIKNTVLDSDAGKEVLRLGVEFMNPSKEALSVIAQYALQFSNVESIDDLEKEGLFVKGYEKKYEVSFCKTEGDFNRILDLRKKVFLVDKNRDIRFADIYDTRSRILMCKESSKLIGSLRLQINDHKEKFEFQKLTKLPQDFPKNIDIIEISRLVADQAYDEDLIIMNLFRRCLYTAIESERDWIIASVPEYYSEKYLMLGFQKTSLSYDINFTEDIEWRHNLYLYDVKAGLSGRYSSGFRWAYLTENSIDLAIMKGVINMSILNRVRNRFFARLFKLALKLKGR